jgi:hypothetical protein
MSMVGTRHGAANILTRAHLMPAPPNGRNGVMVFCYPWVQGMQEAPAKREERHVPLSDTLVTMKIIDTLVANTA